MSAIDAKDSPVAKKVSEEVAEAYPAEETKIEETKATEEAKETDKAESKDDDKSETKDTDAAKPVATETAVADETAAEDAACDSKKRKLADITKDDGVDNEATAAAEDDESGKRDKTAAVPEAK